MMPQRGARAARGRRSGAPTHRRPTAEEAALRTQGRHPARSRRIHARRSALHTDSCRFARSPAFDPEATSTWSDWPPGNWRSPRRETGDRYRSWSRRSPVRAASPKAVIRPAEQRPAASDRGCV